MSVQICSDATWPMFGTTGGEKKSACPWFDFTHLWFPMRGVSCFTPRGNVSVSMTDATKQDSKISRFPIILLPVIHFAGGLESVFYCHFPYFFIPLRDPQFFEGKTQSVDLQGSNK